MISRFFKRKPKPEPKKAISKAPSKKSSLKITPPAEASSATPLPLLKPGKTITAEGWKRMMLRKSGKK